VNGETFVIYTTELGGTYEVARATPDEYRQAIETGCWRDVDTKMIAFLRVEENHDFVLGGAREKPETWKPEVHQAMRQAIA
jgi:hypothetical protein